VHKRFGVLLLAMGLWSALSACGSQGPSPLGGTWTLVAAPGITIETKQEAPRFQFTEGGRLNVVTNCTEFSAPVTVAGSTFAFGELSIRTTATCTTRDHEIEDALVPALRQATELSGGLPGDRLRLSGPAGELVLAQPVPDLPFNRE
jgi:heat shock protein HslJ